MSPFSSRQSRCITRTDQPADEPDIRKLGWLNVRASNYGFGHDTIYFNRIDCIKDILLHFTFLPRHSVILVLARVVIAIFKIHLKA